MKKILDDVSFGENSFKALAVHDEDIIEKQEEFAEIKNNFKNASDDFETIYIKVMANAKSVICRADDLSKIYNEISGNYSIAEIEISDKILEDCVRDEELTRALDQLESDKEILEHVEEYDRKLRVWTIRNLHKMNKTEWFLQQFEVK